MVHPKAVLKVDQKADQRAVLTVGPWVY
jgi:hypothetical protein